MNHSRTNRLRSGQAALEYILMLSIIAAVGLVAKKVVERLSIEQRLSQALNEPFARTYRYGHPDAKGYEDGNRYNAGGPVMHPRIGDMGGQNFRVFINPYER